MDAQPPRQCVGVGVARGPGQVAFRPAAGSLTHARDPALAVVGTPGFADQVFDARQAVRGGRCRLRASWCTLASAAATGDKSERQGPTCSEGHVRPTALGAMR